VCKCVRVSVCVYVSVCVSMCVNVCVGGWVCVLTTNGTANGTDCPALVQKRL